MLCRPNSNMQRWPNIRHDDDDDDVYYYYYCDSVLCFGFGSSSPEIRVFGFALKQKTFNFCFLFTWALGRERRIVNDFHLPKNSVVIINLKIGHSLNILETPVTLHLITRYHTYSQRAERNSHRCLLIFEITKCFSMFRRSECHSLRKTLLLYDIRKIMNITGERKIFKILIFHNHLSSLVREHSLFIEFV
jgi:hypothetical protein